MTLEEAIKILSDSANAGITTFDEKFKKAERLGIAALQALPQYRNKLRHPELWPLPGETEDRERR